MYELSPGEASPYHWHVGEEEVCLVVTGRPTLRTPDAECELRPWDVAWFLRGAAGAHQLHNDTDEPARVVFFSTVADPEVAVYPDEDKIGVLAQWSREDAPTIRGWVQKS